jgi:hypothetical protein
MSSFPNPLTDLASCIVLSCTVASVLVGASPQPPLSPRFIRASISVNRPSFVVGRDEVDITFEAVNESPSPVRYTELREDTVLIINGKELKASGYIFGNGPHPVGELLTPGSKYQFGYRLTDKFNTPGHYRVVWRGKHFKTKAISFSVVRGK